MISYRNITIIKVNLSSVETELYFDYKYSLILRNDACQLVVPSGSCVTGLAKF